MQMELDCQAYPDVFFPILLFHSRALACSFIKSDHISFSYKQSLQGYYGIMVAKYTIESNPKKKELQIC